MTISTIPQGSINTNFDTLGLLDARVRAQVPSVEPDAGGALLPCDVSWVPATWERLGPQTLDLSVLAVIKPQMPELSLLRPALFEQQLSYAIQAMDSSVMVPRGLRKRVKAVLEQEMALRAEVDFNFWMLLQA